ncbi:MAG: sugar phosphate isomerase/epimerase [Bacteroidota bacterium]
MSNNRREFLSLSGKVAAGALILPQMACTSNTTNSSPEVEKTTEDMASTGTPLAAYGIQLWTLRDIIGKDPKGILKQLADFGYTQIESFEGDQGIYWGMSPTDFKSYMDDIGLNMIASHCNINENFEEKAAQAAEVGMDYLLCPYIGPQDSMDKWKTIVDQFNKCGEICKKNGIRFAYHNHDYSFKAVDGVIPQDYMMENTDPDSVDFELDLYWVITGGADPIAYLKKYPNRFALSHVKDRDKNAKADETHMSVTLGTGSIDYQSILQVAKENGMKYYLLEQERYEGTTPIKCAEDGAKYFNQLRLS